MHAFSIKASELGVDISQFAKLGSKITSGTTSKRWQYLQLLIAILNMGPRTGQPVYDVGYSNKIINYLSNQCRSGKVTGLESIREAITVDAVSGEVISINGYCIE